LAITREDALLSLSLRFALIRYPAEAVKIAAVWPASLKAFPKALA
jgi:hypothetical protein